MKNSISKVLSWVFISILTIIALLVLILFIATKLSSDKIPSIFGYKPFIVLSGSMETEINKGDLAIFKNVDTKSLKEKDIIAFRDKDDYVITHRIVEVNNDNGTIKFITKGDNNNIKDADDVEASAIEGIYLFKISGLGNVLLFLQKPSTLIIALILIFGGGILYMLYDNGKMTMAEKKELEELRAKQRKKVK